MTSLAKNYYMCLECGDIITNGGQCSCNGILMGIFGEIYSVEGATYEEVSRETAKRGNVE